MINKKWQLQSPINAISFDCDGTLSHIEGIDYLAQLNDTHQEVHELTHQAMQQTGLSKDLYHKRLELVRPNRAQTDLLTQAYIANITPGLQEVIALFKSLNKALYILSAGNNPSVTQFGEYLGVSKKNCYAVDIYFDKNNQYTGFDAQSVLIQNQGKATILDQIKKTHGSVLHIGDGMNDISCADSTDRFIGYGGHFPNPNVKKQAEYYISHKSLLAMLPFCLTKDEVDSLTSTHKQTYQAGFDLLMR